MKLPNYHHDIHLCWQTLPLELGLFWVHEPAHVFGLWVVWRQGPEAYISLVYGIYINSCELWREVGNRASGSPAGWPTQLEKPASGSSPSPTKNIVILSASFLSVFLLMLCVACLGLKLSIFVKVLGEEMWKLSRRDLLCL